MANKLPIHGLKLSCEQLLLRLPAGGEPHPREILRRLAQAKINLTCVVLEQQADHGLATVCCIDAEDRPGVERVLDELPESAELRADVGTLTVFPHRYRLDLLATVLGALGRADIPLLGMAASLSALTVILSHRQLDAAAEAVCSVAQLPENHAPFRPEFRVRQV